MEKNSIRDLDILLKFINAKYDIVTQLWKESETYVSLNMKRKKVIHVYRDERILLGIFNYQDFVAKLHDNFAEELENLQKNSIVSQVTSRIKNINSIQEKLENYNREHCNGEIPLKKCLNDILGIRIIFDETVEFDEIKKFVVNNYPSLKCIKSEKKGYNAIHIYFGNDDNWKFQWELQIWDKFHENSNRESHAKYKQNYVKWEQENY